MHVRHRATQFHRVDLLRIADEDARKRLWNRTVVGRGAHSCAHSSLYPVEGALGMGKTSDIELVIPKYRAQQYLLSISKRS